MSPEPTRQWTQGGQGTHRTHHRERGGWGGGHGAGPEGDRHLPGGMGAPEVSLQQVPPPRSPALTNLCPRGGGGPPGPTSETVPALTGGEELQGDRPADPRRAVPPGGH